MDAFAVATCKGLATRTLKFRHLLYTGLWFGGFQALMPLLGYLLGSAFAVYIDAIDHWIAAALLTLIGANMIREARAEEDRAVDGSFGVRAMFPLAIATSIDAFAVGIAFSMRADVRILPTVGTIGIVTFSLAAIGVRLGSVFGARYRSHAECIGGGVLILLGIKFLLDGLGIFG